MLVHCRNGQNRACFAVYAFLRLFHEMDHNDALRLVHKRVDVQGRSLFDFSYQRPELIEWVNSSGGLDLQAESGICCWEQGYE